jgi:shikimate kinase
MGCGKTTVGLALAELLRWEFVDLDEYIERQEQLSIRELFAQRGEEEFRNMEHLALRALVAASSRPTVIALGGGTFVQPQNESILRDARVRSVFLELPVEELLRRCDSSTDGEQFNPRPLAADPAEFRRLHDQRLPFYRRADVTIDANSKTGAAIAQEIGARLQLASAP